MVLCEVWHPTVQRAKQVANPIGRPSPPIEPEIPPESDTNDLATLALETNGGGFQGAIQIVGDADCELRHVDSICTAIEERCTAIGIPRLLPKGDFA